MMNILKKIYFKIRLNILFGLFFTGVIFFPDAIFAFIFPKFSVSFDYRFIFSMIVFGFFLSLSGRLVFSVVCVLLAVIQFVQLNHIAYFGRPINPVDVRKIFAEFSDVWSSGVGAINDIWFVIPLVLFSFGALFFVFFKYKKQLGFSVFAALVVLVALSVKPERAYRKELKHFLPAETRYSIHNSLNTFSFFAVKGWALPTKDLVPNDLYDTVMAQKVSDPQSDLVVLVMGESMTFSHMGAFGYDRPTTPLLSALSQDKNAFFKKTIAGAVSTHSALPIFFNLMNEPGNITALKDENVNLFKLAHQAGYKTYWISAQDAKNTYSIGSDHIDEIVTYEEDVYDFETDHDRNLLSLFDDLDLSKGKHFVVLHMRSLHSPFESNYDGEEQFEKYSVRKVSRLERTINAYDNAMLYADDVIYKMYQMFLKKEESKKGVFLLTSDHGQLLGENGMYGHNLLIPETAYVPFIMYSKLPYDQIKADLNRYSFATHYQIGKAIANILGYNILNPNEIEGVFFVQGNDLFTDYGILEGKQKKDQAITYKPLVTLSDYVMYRKSLKSAK